MAPVRKKAAEPVVPDTDMEVIDLQPEAAEPEPKPESDKLGAWLGEVDDMLANARAEVAYHRAEIEAAIAKHQAALDKATQRLATVEFLAAVRDGKVTPPTTNTPTPKKPAKAATASKPGRTGKISDGIQALLDGAGAKGLTRGELVSQLGAADDKKAQQSISNFLALGKKTGKLLYNEASKSYAVNA